MTFEELDRAFPNGFDDAEITGIAIDYTKRMATLQLKLRGNSPDSPERDVYAPAVLRVLGVYYLSIEPPDQSHIIGPESNAITVDGLPEDPHNYPLFGHIKAKLPDGAFCCRFFVHDWNSFIHIAASGAEFSWVSTNAGGS
ncbi:MAG TPA: hypothetical protein VNY24_01150 [Candidatus Acidoferrales bacterium]|nr:hypothetical protein [Candidatus Acidoferrales bacterium]